MTQNGTILVCILPNLEADVLHHYVVNAVSFARRTSVDIHFLASEDTQKALSSAINGIPAREFQEIKTVSHQIAGNWPPRVVSEAAKLYSCDLIVIPSGSIAEESGCGAQLRKDLLKQVSTPIMILSPRVDFEKTPIGSVLVPISGEIRVSSALKFGLRIASRIHIPVDLVHVVQENTQTKSPLETICGQSHHEYRNLLDRVLSEASPYSDMRERAQVRTLYHVRGTPSVEILKAAKNAPSCALVVEWRGEWHGERHGSLTHGKAETMKNLLEQVVVPIFLVKTEVDRRSFLNIGQDDRVA
jgi:nucleotide-binding universal stress UspA family protein